MSIFAAEIARIMAYLNIKLDTITYDYMRVTTLVAVIFSDLGGDIRKFSSVPKLVAYAGLYPKSRQSGEYKINGHMFKRGAPYLRRAVCGLPIPLPLLKILLSVFSTKRDALRVKTI